MDQVALEFKQNLEFYMEDEVAHKLKIDTILKIMQGYDFDKDTLELTGLRKVVERYRSLTRYSQFAYDCKSLENKWKKIEQAKIEANKAKALDSKFAWLSQKLAAKAQEIEFEKSLSSDEMLDFANANLRHENPRIKNMPLVDLKKSSATVRQSLKALLLPKALINNEALSSEKKVEKAKIERRPKMNIPPAPLDPNSCRVKAREMLSKALNLGEDASPLADKMAIKLEEAIFEKFKNTDVEYKRCLRSRIFNLTDKKNPNLRLNFLSGAITAKQLAAMTTEKMASNEMVKLRAKIVQESIFDAKLAINEDSQSDLIKCERCLQKNCTYKQIQTRSADEEMTTFVLCNACGHRWQLD